MKKTLRSLTIVTLAVMAFCFALSEAHAGQETQTVTNALAVATTNTIAIPADVTGSFTNGSTISGSQYITGGVRAEAAFGEVGGYFRNTTAQASNITFRVAQSITGGTWTNSALVVTVIVPASSTNWAFTQFRISSPAPFYSLRTVENSNVAGVTADASTCYLKVVSKTGL